jgi:hypothetical protein
MIKSSFSGKIHGDGEEEGDGSDVEAVGRGRF